MYSCFSNTLQYIHNIQKKNSTNCHHSPHCKPPQKKSQQYNWQLLKHIIKISLQKIYLGLGLMKI